jgi:DNA gyrase subunit A
MARNGQRDGSLILATRRGVIKRTPLENFANVRRNGLHAITVDPEDELAWVEAAQSDEDIMLVTTDGRAVRFPQNKVRSMGRTAGGVHGIRLREGDSLVFMGLAKPDHDLLVVTQRGIGKRTPVDGYRQQGRNGQGVYTIKNVDKVGTIVAAAIVSANMEMVLMSAGGQVIRQPVSVVRQTGRNTQGVRVMRLNEGDSVVSMACMVIQNPEGDTVEANGDVAEANGEIHLDDVHEETAELTALAELSDGGDDEIELSEPDEIDAD